jgi:hypothetical protein
MHGKAMTYVCLLTDGGMYPTSSPMRPSVARLWVPTIECAALTRGSIVPRASSNTGTMERQRSRSLIRAAVAA